MQKIQATGYCLGNTLLALSAAAMGIGNLQAFRRSRPVSISPKPVNCAFSSLVYQLSFLKEIMQAGGFLSSAQMGVAFQILRSNDLTIPAERAVSRVASRFEIWGKGWVLSEPYLLG
jgi:polyhydroxyalkanoate synthase